MSGAPTFTYSHGIATVQNGRCQIRLSRFRPERRDDSVRAEITATCDDRTIVRTAWNLTSTRDAKSLTGHLEEQVADVRWSELLQFTAWRAIDAYRAGAPLVRVGKLERRPDQVIMAPLLRRNQPTILYGPGGTGKSLFAAGVAVALQSRCEVLPGLQTRIDGPVLILDWETDAQTWNEAVGAVCRGAGIAPLEVLYQRMYRPLADCIEEVASLIEEHGVMAIVVDSTEAALTPGDNFNGGAQSFFNALRELEVTALVIDHVSGENAARDGAAKPIGGIAKMNRARAVWELRAEREPEPGRIELALIDRKRNGRARQPTIGLTALLEDQDEDGVAHSIRWEPSRIEAEELQRAGLGKRERMRRLLEPGAMSIAEAAEELGMTPGGVRVYVSRYREFVAVGRGEVGLAQ